MATITSLTIPTDLDSWNPADATRWLSDVEDDPAVTDSDFRRAQEAVNRAILD